MPERIMIREGTVDLVQFQKEIQDNVTEFVVGEEKLEAFEVAIERFLKDKTTETKLLILSKKEQIKVLLTRDGSEVTVRVKVPIFKKK